MLWDIDGTLVRSARLGAFKEYTAPVLEEIFGTAGRLAEMSVSGMTDLQIAIEALACAGFTADQVIERAREIQELYMREMLRVTTGEKLFLELPGARQTLEATDASARYMNALLTGNIEPAARLKMRAVGLERFFKLPGAFGEDSHDRRDLPALAARRISSRLGLELQPSQFIIIGDTPNDIACAKHFGARCVAVATSRYYTAEELTRHKPDALLPDLTDLDLVMRTFDAL